jgi:hypothetical protein
MADNPKVPAFEVLDGELHGDGWTSQRLAVRFPKEKSDRVIKASIRNPGFNEAYLRNTLTVSFDGQQVFCDVLFAGQGVQVDQRLPAGEEILLELHSEACLLPDALDQRERGVILKLSETTG